MSLRPLRGLCSIPIPWSLPMIRSAASRAAKGANGEALGDCVDRGLCVAVCPTGIDIRRVSVRVHWMRIACIDACDPVMDKVGKPRGLIRYTTEKRPRKHFSAKRWSDIFSSSARSLYTAILLAIIATLGVVVGNPGAFEGRRYS